MLFVDTTPYKKKRKRSYVINCCSFIKIIAALIQCKACLCGTSLMFTNCIIALKRMDSVHTEPQLGIFIKKLRLDSELGEVNFDC